jgi:hypothetical protein
MPISNDATHPSALVGTGVMALHTEGLFFRRLRPHQGRDPNIASHTLSFYTNESHAAVIIPTNGVYIQAMAIVMRWTRILHGLLLSCPITSDCSFFCLYSSPLPKAPTRALFHEGTSFIGRERRLRFHSGPTRPCSVKDVACS